EPDSQTVTTIDSVFSEAKNVKTSWAVQIEEIEEAKLKNVDHQKQTETCSVNVKTTTSKSNKTASPDTEHVSDKKDQSASDTSPSHEKTPKSTSFTETATTNDKEPKPRQ
ncbi:15264_t:CDS:2, partial [Dentiscutata heterogama]